MKTKGFTLIELMVVILIVGILAAASIPLMRGRIDSAKWSEANAMAGTIKSAVRVAFAEDPTTVGAWSNEAVADVMTTLGFDAGDLSGTYFLPACFTVTSIDPNGNAVVTVDATNGTGKAPSGSYQLEVDGDWVKQ